MKIKLVWEVQPDPFWGYSSLQSTHLQAFTHSQTGDRLEGLKMPCEVTDWGQNPGSNSSILELPHMHASSQVPIGALRWGPLPGIPGLDLQPQAEP
jgi:hypothetical protein